MRKLVLLAAGILIGVFITLNLTPFALAAANVNQSHFRWRNSADDNNLANEDTNYTAAEDHKTYTLVFQFNNTGTTGWKNKYVSLEYSRNGAPWMQINDDNLTYGDITGHSDQEVLTSFIIAGSDSGHYEDFSFGDPKKFSVAAGQQYEIHFGILFNNIGNYSLRIVETSNRESGTIVLDEYGIYAGATVSDNATPNVTNIGPSNGIAYELTSLVNVTLSAYVTDGIGVDSVLANITWDSNSQLVTLTDPDSDSNYAGYFTNTSILTRYNITIIANDTSGNINNSETTWFRVNDTQGPRFVTTLLNPNSTDDVDPGIQINITANVSDYTNVSAIIFQYKQNSATVWTNVTMANISPAESSTNGEYNATFTPNVNGIWNYRMWANDTFGNSGYSNQSNLSVEYDYTWNISTTDFGTISGILSSNKSIGVLIINNTGDYTLNFDLSDDAPYGSSYNETEPFDLVAKAVKHINITMTFGSTSREDSVIITADATSANAEPSERNTTLILASYAGGAYLYSTLINYPATVNQSGSITLYGSVKNIGNETALNTTLSWIMPSSYWTNGSGNLTQEPINLTADSLTYNNVTINVSPLVSPGSYTIYLNSTCDNSYGTCSDLESFTIYVYCYSGDGVCGAGCTYDASSVAYDSDCPAPVSVGVGGGGIVITPKPEKIKYSKIIEIVRGENDSLDIEVYNSYKNSTLEDLTLELTGFLEQYISFSPSKISRISYNKTGKFTVVLKTPFYKSYEEYTLKAVIKGELVTETTKKSYTEIQNIQLIIQEISREEAKISLEKAGKAVGEMQQNGFNVDEARKLLEQAKQKLEDRRNKEVRDLADKISGIGEKALFVYNLIREVLEAERDPGQSYLLVGNAVGGITIEENILPLRQFITGKTIFSTGSIEEMISLAVIAFERGDYNTAEERADSARVLLLLERKGNPGLFLYLYWHFLLLGVAVFSIAGILGYKKYQKSGIAEKIEDINKEEVNIGKLVQETQTKYFSGKVNAKNYQAVMGQHGKRLAQIRKIRSRLRNRRIRILGPRQILKELEAENQQIESEIKKLQEDYYKDRKIPESEYNIHFKMLNERLTEVEGERATLQIIQHKKALK